MIGSNGAEKLYGMVIKKEHISITVKLSEVKMKYRKLGETGLEVSELGFGAWGIGGGDYAYGKTDDKESVAALEYAFDNGINFYDTADLYGQGHSEHLIGKTFRSRRDDVIIASKFGFYLRDKKPVHDFSVKHLTESIDNSLRRLQTDYIDLYQLHSPDISVLENSDLLSELQKLQQQGKIRVIGISPRSPQEALVAIKNYAFKSVQINFNLIDQRAYGDGLFDLAVDEKIGVICRTPLCFGFLTGLLNKDTKFPADDHRSNWTPRQIELWAGALDKFKDIYSSRYTPIHFALKFCLAFKGVSTVISGMMRVSEVKDNLSIFDKGDLTSDDLTSISSVYKANTFFDRTSGT
jgi:aryl-alcohol dehydrogenase-like predicted oxidoreductase